MSRILRSRLANTVDESAQALGLGTAAISTMIQESEVTLVLSS